MRRYTLEVTITEGNDEFWESLAGISGCDTVVDEIKSCLADRGFTEPGAMVRLTKFENE